MQLKLTPLSPVHIGADKTLSPLTDYFYDNDKKVAYIDHKKLEEFLENCNNSKEIIDDFVKRVRAEKSQEPEKYNIYEFLEKNKQNPDDFVKKRLPVTEPKELKNQNIDIAISNAGRPYIPGSSLKGAIRTALIYYELSNDETMLSSLHKQIQEVEKLKQKWKKDKDKKKLNEFQEKIYDSYGNDVMKFLHISDTSCFPEDILKIYHAKRVNINNPEKTPIPMNYEGITPNLQNVTFEIKTKAKKNFHEKTHKKIKPYLFEGNEEEIFQYINKFSKGFIDSEIETLQDRAEQLGNILPFYNDIREQIQNLNREKEAILCIGKGKSFFNSTVVGLFPEDSKKNLRELFKLGYSDKGKNYVEPFPITRTVYYENGNIAGVFGWVKIEYDYISSD